LRASASPCMEVDAAFGDHAELAENSIRNISSDSAIRHNELSRPCDHANCVLRLVTIFADQNRSQPKSSCRFAVGMRPIRLRDF
jgi:hypothetical protein